MRLHIGGNAHDLKRTRSEYGPSNNLLKNTCPSMQVALSPSDHSEGHNVECQQGPKKIGLIKTNFTDNCQHLWQSVVKKASYNKIAGIRLKRKYFGISGISTLSILGIIFDSRKRTQDFPWSLQLAGNGGLAAPSPPRRASQRLVW